MILIFDFASLNCAQNVDTLESINTREHSVNTPVCFAVNIYFFKSTSI